jgi:hypothetical protein
MVSNRYSDLRFGHQIPLKACRAFSLADLHVLNRCLQAIDPHIRTVLPVKNDAQSVKPGDRLMLTLRDEDTLGRQASVVQYRQQAGLPVPPHLHPALSDRGRVSLRQPPIVVEKTLESPQTIWQKIKQAWHKVMRTEPPALWRTRYYAEGNTLWELAANTVARVQNALLDADVYNRLGVSIDWPNRRLPYEWQGFMMKPATLHYPLHHNERLTEASFWPEAVPGSRQIVPGSYPVDTYLDTSRTGHNAFNHAYPYVHEAFSPPTDYPPPKVVKLTRQHDTYRPPGAWLTLQATKPVNVFSLFSLLSDQIRQHQNPLVHTNGMQGLPLNSTTLPAGHTMWLYVGHYGGVNWAGMTRAMETHLPRLMHDLQGLGLKVLGKTHAENPHPHYDVDDPAAYQALKQRLLVKTKP